ncbi:hemin uptake protein HemP [Sulfuricystis thermophila]|uniref:hemin uptake protein HemP n=1 Tax=Sulfuricystis thermophila TaxID=2496847 RepID=UPI001035E852|nr:hemin uptake protein HemP [Sulfuricystis thermophila]
MTASDGNEPRGKSLPHQGNRAWEGYIDSRELFAGRKEILIRHEGEIYRLRLTRQNKLILTK